MNIDWNSIEGYHDDMSAEEKLALLDSYTPPAQTEPEQSPDYSAQTTPASQASPPAQHNKPVEPVSPKPGYISKREFDKVASDLAAAKRQLRSRMSEEEQREADRQAEIAAREEELKSLRRDKTLSNHRASFLGLGLSEELATDAATMLCDGDSDGLFDVLKRHQVGFEKALRTKILAETPKPPSTTDPNGEEAKKQDFAQLRKYFGLS